MTAFHKYRILIFSENPDKLVPFYRDVLGLCLDKHYDLPGDYGYMFEVSGEMMLWLGKHSGVKGKNKDKFRHIYNLYVDSVLAWYNKVKSAQDVTIVCEPCETPLSTPEKRVYVSTFLDPKDNCWQFMGGK